MPDDLAAELPPPPAVAASARVRVGLRKPANWLQLVRFAVVGASGYLVNLAVFAVVVHALAAGHRVGATAAFAVALANNFVWNRRWTFRARDGRAGFQAARFLIVSVSAFGLNLLVLELLVTGGLAELPAQAVAVACATPVNFLGNKLWSFRA